MCVGWLAPDLLPVWAPVHTGLLVGLWLGWLAPDSLPIRAPKPVEWLVVLEGFGAVGLVVLLLGGGWLAPVCRL